ncbi:MAG TPA: CerR family C-terminal domain-containing protein [Candidatus Binatia bacterium]
MKTPARTQARSGRSADTRSGRSSDTRSARSSDTRSARSADTRRRLLEAAGEVFADEGFRAATIQEICRRARANIAAVHYHFGDKERLYAATIDYAHQFARERSDASGETPASATPGQRLRLHIGSFLSRLLDGGRPAWHAKLMAREMIDPTPELDRLVRDRMRATHKQLGGIVRELLGAGASSEIVKLMVLSIVGQCVFYRHSAPVIARLYPEIDTPRDVERIADHIARFSLDAIRAQRAQRGQRERKKPR